MSKLLKSILTLLVWNDNIVLIASVNAIWGAKETYFKVDSSGYDPINAIKIYYIRKPTIAAMIPGLALVKNTEIKMD